MTNNEVVRFTFRIPKKRMEELKVRSNELGVSVNALILQILRDWAKSNAEKPGA